MGSDNKEIPTHIPVQAQSSTKAKQPKVFCFEGYNLKVYNNYKWGKDKSISIITADFCLVGTILHEQTFEGVTWYVKVRDGTDSGDLDLPKKQMIIIS